MAEMVLDDLLRILTECAGTDETVDLTGDVLDRSLEDLGYDSLALLETTARIEQVYGVALSDDEIVGQRTPRAVLDVVNSLVAERPS